MKKHNSWTSQLCHFLLHITYQDSLNWLNLNIYRRTEISLISAEHLCQRNVRLLVNQCLPSITKISSEVDNSGNSYIASHKSSNVSLEWCSCIFSNKRTGLGERMEKRKCCWNLCADLKVSLAATISRKTCQISWKLSNSASSLTETQIVDAVLIWGFAFIRSSHRLKLTHVKQTWTDYMKVIF